MQAVAMGSCCRPVPVVSSNGRAMTTGVPSCFFLHSSDLVFGVRRRAIPRSFVACSVGARDDVAMSSALVPITRAELRPKSGGVSAREQRRGAGEIGNSDEEAEEEGGVGVGVGVGVRGADMEASSSSAAIPFTLFSVAPMILYPAIAEGAGYSQASYYTSLGLFVISVPGIWSLIKRSTKSKIVKKTFVVPGPSVDKGKPPGQIAGEITSSLTRNNFKIADRGETVTFEGVMNPSRGQAAFLSFCTAVSLACVALVLSITVPDVGENWYWLTLLSPLAGAYYWTRASRTEQIKVKMVVADDETSTDVILQGDDEQIDRLRRELELMEKGMVYVKGLLER